MFPALAIVADQASNENQLYHFHLLPLPVAKGSPPGKLVSFLIWFRLFCKKHQLLLGTYCMESEPCAGSVGCRRPVHVVYAAASICVPRSRHQHLEVPGEPLLRA